MHATSPDIGAATDADTRLRQCRCDSAGRNASTPLPGDDGEWRRAAVGACSQVSGRRPARVWITAPKRTAVFVRTVPGRQQR